MVRGLKTLALHSPVNVATMRLQELESVLDITPRRSEHSIFVTAFLGGVHQNVVVDREGTATMPYPNTSSSLVGPQWADMLHSDCNGYRGELSHPQPMARGSLRRYEHRVHRVLQPCSAWCAIPRYIQLLKNALLEVQTGITMEASS